MTTNGPRFLDEEPAAPQPSGSAPTPETPPKLPRGPLLLDPIADAPDRLGTIWQPDKVAAPAIRVGAAFWAASGLCAIVLAWTVLSLATFVVGLFERSAVLGCLGAVAMSAAAAMVLYAIVLELRAYRSLTAVEHLRGLLADPAAPLASVRSASKAWLRRVRLSVPDEIGVERLLDASATPAELRAVLRSQVADRLQDAARVVGRRAAIEGATIVAICPHPAWDGIVAGLRAILVMRQVATLYGMRPGLAVTLTLMRRAAATAATTTAVTLLSQELADHALSAIPGVKHASGALGAGTVAIRLYRLACFTAQACTPV